MPKVDTMTREDDKTAILAVVKAETEAFLQRDLEALSSYWVHAPYSRRMVSVANLGTHVFMGWDEIRENYRNLIALLTDKQPISRISWEHVNVVVSGDMAFVTYDQVGELGDDKFMMGGVIHELKIFQTHFIVGITNSAPERMPVGQRDVMVLSLV
jgi:ketosteroid isomerase-like protein